LYRCGLGVAQIHACFDQFRRQSQGQKAIGQSGLSVLHLLCIGRCMRGAWGFQVVRRRRGKSRLLVRYVGLRRRESACFI